MIGDIAINILFCLGEIGVLACSSIALCGSAWIRDVSSEGENDKYFIRVNGMEDQTLLYSSMNDGEFQSIGLWRLTAGEGRSYPIPIRDTQMNMVVGGYMVQIIMASFCLFVVSFQLFGLFNRVLELEMTVGWACFFQCILVIAATATGYSYFKETFDYNSFGVCLYFGWVALVVSILVLVISVFKIVMAYKSRSKDPKPQNTMTFREKPQPLKEFQPIMATPEPRPYTPTSYRQQPPPDRFRPESRTQTIQSQHHGEFSMRRTPSYDSRQFPGGAGGEMRMEYTTYDQGDMPKHIR